MRLTCDNELSYSWPSSSSWPKGYFMVYWSEDDMILDSPQLAADGKRWEHYILKGVD